MPLDRPSNIRRHGLKDHFSISFLYPIRACSELYEQRDFNFERRGRKRRQLSFGINSLDSGHRTPKALVLFVHGSGITDRDESLPSGNHPFKDIAEKLSEDGFATLRFDKRGIQPECRPPLVDNQHLSPWNYVQDIQNIIQFISSDPEMKKLPLVLLGHSEGVNFVTEIASSGSIKLKAVVLLAGLGKYSIDETILRQYEQLSQAPGLSPDDKLKLQKLIDDGKTFFQKIHDGTILPSDRYMSVYSKYWVDWIEISRNGANSARRVLVPSFVVRGTADFNVTGEDFDALKGATQDIPGSSSFAPAGLNHYLALPGAQVVAPKVPQRISEWLQHIE